MRNAARARGGSPAAGPAARHPALVLALRGLLVCLPLLLWAAPPAAAHVGNLDVFFEGEAGPYPVRVTVRPPGVVPGLAEITVRVDGASRVTARPIHAEAGEAGAPPPDEAVPVRGAPGVWSTELWLMTGGSYSVEVAVEGERGRGTVVVPVASIATRQLEMGPALGTLLALLGLLLVAGAVSVVGAVVRESTLPPGAAPGPRRRRAARLAMTATAALLGLVLAGGRSWWESEEAEYRTGIYRSPEVETAVGGEGDRVLRLEVTDPEWRREGKPLVPDHGKLMHMFLVREGFDAFAHLHPVPSGEEGETALAYEVTLPPVPAGTYHVYADVTEASGFAHTLVDRVEVPAAEAAEAAEGVSSAAPERGASPGPAPDPDDSWQLGAAAGPGSRVAELPGGFEMRWEAPEGVLVAGREMTLRFTVRGPDGGEARLEPYMGMLSHAAVRRDDGAVFVHLHPTGTVSMAAQEVLARRPGAGAVEAPGAAGGSHSGHGGAAPAAHGGAEPSAHAAHAGRRPAAGGTVSFPFAFPRPGSYHVWVQVKTGGRVLTGVFAADVAPGPDSDPRGDST